MRRLHLWGGAALTALIITVGITALRPTARVTTVPDLAPTASRDLSGTWQIDWTASTAQTIGRSPTHSRIALTATVALTPLAGDRHALRFDTIDALQMHVAGTDTLAPPDALLGHTLIFTRSASGAPDRFWTAKGAPPGFAHLATALARRMTRLTPGTPTEITPLGTARLTFDGDTRQRTYVALTGGASAAITGDSAAQVTADQIDDREAISAGSTTAEVRFTAHRIGAATPPPAVAFQVEHFPGRPSATAHQRALQTQAGSLDRQRLLDGLLGFAATQTSPSSEWLWRAVGRLRLNPELAAELGALLPGLSPFGQALIADLLASAGHPQAQAALCAALDDPKLIATPVNRARLLQRLGFVKAPTAESAAFVEALAQDDDIRMRRAAHLTRGGMARQMDDPTPIVEALIDATHADEPAEARAAIAGLGNTAHPDAAPAIFEQTAANDPVMRRTAAQALRLMPDADDTLARMAGDPVDTVQQAALAALNQRAPTPAVAGHLRARLQDGTLGDAQRNQVVTLAERATRDDAQTDAWRPVLEALLARAQGDPRLAARVRRLLNRPRG